MKQKLLFLLVLLLTATMSTWAQTTHVVTQTTVDNIFNGDGYTLGDAVAAGDVLDFQGEIDLQHSLIVNKQVTIKSTTTDAVVKLNTPTNVKSDEYSATVMYPQSFVINKAGSGTTVQDIRIENTETWLFNTSNVTFTGVTMWVEEARIGSGVGHVSIRYSDHVTFDGCTVYTKNNGGSAGCLLAGSHDCTFKDTRFESVGTTGNVLYLGNPYNTNDKPAGYTMNDDNISVLNCTLTKDVASATCMFAIGGLRHHIEGCTIVNMRTSSAFGVTGPNSADEGHTILNNTITDGNLDVLKYCTAEGNTVTGTGSVTINQGATANNNTITVTGTSNVTINQEATATNNTITVTGTGAVRVNKGSTVTGNNITGNVTINSNSSDFVGSTITGNTINGTVTFAANSKNNTLTRNVITSTGDYAVVMATTKDANNTVQYNTLKSAMYNGDEAVNPSTGSGNTISNNSNIAITLAEGTEDADKWTVKVGEEAAAFPVGGLKGGETVTVTYSGEKKVKSVKAVKKADNTYLKWDADQKKLVATDIPTTAIKVENTNQNVEWAAGTYVVEGEVNINGKIYLTGNVDLIIKDGAKLTATRINSPSNDKKTLSIYGQSKMNGELVINTTSLYAIDYLSTLAVHSCKVTAYSTSSGGIFAVNTINVYGGLLDAKYTGSDGYGIFLSGGGKMNIYGGEVKAASNGTGVNSYGIMASTYDSAITVTVYGGKLWAESPGNTVFNTAKTTFAKGDGFTGKIYTSDDGSSWIEWTTESTPNTKYVKVE